MNRISTIICALLTFSYIYSSAQSGNEKSLSRKARTNFYVANYLKSIPYYQKLVEINPNSFDYNYNLGVSYFYSSTSSDKVKARPYFEKALSLMGKDTIPEIFYFLGQTEQIDNRFDNAISYYKVLKTFLDTSNIDTRDTQEVDNYISQCNNAKEFITTPVPVKIVNLGNNINSEYGDYSPVISADESILIFTSKRKGTTGGKKDDDGKYFEDIYISTSNNKRDWALSEKLDTTEEKLSFFKLLFSKASNIGKSINTRGHDASVSLSPDGKKLYIFRQEDIWSAERDGSKWSKPKRLDGTINSEDFYEPSVCPSPDGKTLYVVSDRPEGYGGTDIYKCSKLTNGSWGQLENLGPTINTPFNEDSPFAHSDGKTFYFSSQGHNSMGGYDIFKTTFEYDNWSKPINIGYPINTAADDVFFVMNAKGNRAYYSSIKKGDNYGDLDLYVIMTLDVPNTSKSLTTYIGTDSAKVYAPMLSSVYTVATSAISSTNKNVKMYSIATENDKNINASVKIKNIALNPDTNQYIAQLSEGKKLFYLYPGETYSFEITPAGFPSHIVDVTIPKGYFDEGQYYQQIKFEDIKDDKGSIIGKKTVVNNVLLNIDSAVASDPILIEQNLEDAYIAYTKNISNNVAFKTYSFNDYIEVTSTIAKNESKQPNIENKKEDIIASSNVIKKGKKDALVNDMKEEEKTTTSNKAKIQKELSSNKIDKETISSNVLNNKTTKETEKTTNTSATRVDSLPTFEPILFDFAKSFLRDESIKELTEIYNYLATNDDIKLIITGHTDSKGSQSFNQALSQKRALAAKKYFTDKGISYNKIKTTGKGELQPIAPNENPDKSDNPEGRQLNRRVQFRLITAKTSK